ncbi:tRNA (guanine-N(7)-)-methyltransferase non-catalytic subunit TRM82 [Pseudocercospora fuligena]|uniref:tRNA (Guanine-N(7)-)-methyltransferase non-catalytic subunit TRM82 n=1 Tax=Pseudocercospora fuligena TaxID=685502 RepID=A0A8H6VC60_9PEZI|nr:tRNA (guanine-N(7)-)-methyltransferase non-catalytic subunit TRM82 [Pseudocercospora fuligena]
MRHPFQSVLYGRDATDTISEGFIIAACGPRLVTLSLTSNEIISEWSANDAPSQPTTQNDQGVVVQELDGERPVKKQKVSNGTRSGPKAPNIIKVAASPDYQHIVAVTEDKCIRVFECQEGRLEELRERCMPKRPCAVQVMPDNATILVGDKFGDVYSLPLIPATIDDVEAETTPADSAPQSTHGFKVAASELTVHSKRNRMALEAQMKQKNFTARKDPLKFDHKLLLGHVSMLTDMKYLLKEVEGQHRGYIITADRDEHIRVSRGPPQAHIIEGFCLGHTQFVSKICQVGSSDLLVSGGGDDWIGVWKWSDFKLLKKIYLKDLVKSVAHQDPINDDYKVAISGIWSAPVQSTESEDILIIAVEKVKALFLISSAALGSHPDHEGQDASAMVAKQLPGVPLDITAFRGELLVSLDNRGDTEKRLGMVGVTIGPDHGIETTKWADVSTKEARSILNALNEYQTRDEVSEKELDELFYGVANLRKRGPQGPGETDEGAVEED